MGPTGEPVGALTTSLTGWLKGMQEGSIIVLALIMGCMLAFDLGGPVNKVAYAFMLICVAEGIYTIVAIAAVGIAIPSFGTGIAALIGRRLFSPEEKETGKAAIVMGCVGVTEGAIPFAASDPLRVIPSTMLGAAVGCAITASVGAECYAGWGGLIVLPVVTGKLSYIFAIAVGSMVTALSIVCLKCFTRSKDKSKAQQEESEDLDITFDIG